MRSISFLNAGRLGCRCTYGIDWSSHASEWTTSVICFPLSTGRFPILTSASLCGRTHTIRQIPFPCLPWSGVTGVSASSDDSLTRARLLLARMAGASAMLADVHLSSTLVSLVRCDLISRSPVPHGQSCFLMAPGGHSGRGSAMLSSGAQTSPAIANSPVRR